MYLFLSWKWTSLVLHFASTSNLISCTEGKTVVCSLTYPHSLQAFAAKENAFLNQRPHSFPLGHPLSQALASLRWNHSYLYQNESISYFPYILIHSLLSYTEKQAFSNLLNITWSAKLIVLVVPSKNKFMPAPTKISDPFKKQTNVRFQENTKIWPLDLKQ